MVATIPERSDQQVNPPGRLPTPRVVERCFQRLILAARHQKPTARSMSADDHSSGGPTGPPNHRK
jgi:hypothetical protein